MLEVTGRRSGKLYLTPVSYVTAPGGILVMTYRHRQWWRNIEDGGELPIYLRGQRMVAMPQVVVDDLDAIGVALEHRSLMRKFVAPAKPEETVMIRLRV